MFMALPAVSSSPDSDVLGHPARHLGPKNHHPEQRAKQEPPPSLIAIPKPETAERVGTGPEILEGTASMPHRVQRPEGDATKATDW